MSTETAEPVPEPLAAKIAAAMLEAEEVTKSSRNKEQGYNFASAESILAAVREPLLKRGVTMLPSRTAVRETEIQSKSGTRGTKVAIDLTFEFDDGAQTKVYEWTGEGQDYGDKAYGKAYTNAVKTFIRIGWMLPTEHDDPEGSDPGERVAVATGPAFGPPASDELTSKLSGALGFLLGDDLEAAAALHTQLVERFDGYMPASVAVALGLAAGAVKRRDEELAAADAHAELDAAADTAAAQEGLDVDPGADTTTGGSTT